MSTRASAYLIEQATGPLIGVSGTSSIARQLSPPIDVGVIMKPLDPPPAMQPEAPVAEKRKLPKEAVTLLRTTQQHHVQLSMMADQKANMLIGATFVVFTLAIGQGAAADFSLPLMILAGYNAGEGAVREYQGVPPYAETRDYVPKVLAAWKVASGLCLTPPRFFSDGCVFAGSS